MIDIICQIMITALGIPIMFLLCSKGWACRKWGVLLGLIVQPFWFLTAYLNDQFGMFIMSMFYTGSFCFGFYNYWIKGEK